MRKQMLSEVEGTGDEERNRDDSILLSTARGRDLHQVQKPTTPLRTGEPWTDLDGIADILINGPRLR